MKRVISLGMLLVGATLLWAPGASAAETCPPGTTDNPYCTPSLVIETPVVTVTKGSTITISLHCKTKPKCQGKLVLVLRGGAKSSAVATASTTVGSGQYSIPFGQTANVQVTLSQSGRAALGKTGKLRAAIVTVQGGKRTVVGTVTVKGKKRVTGVQGQPGFTG